MPDLRAGRALICGAGLLLAASLSAPQLVFASCSANIPASDTDVYCTGNDSLGVRAPSAENVSVTIDSDASITTADSPAIYLGAGATVRNFGALSSADTYTVLLSGGDDTLLNSGNIGGAVNLGDGDNHIQLDGGRIGTYLLSGSGADTLEWRSGWVGDSILLGDGDDSATLDDANGADGTLLAAGLGNDRLLFRHQQYGVSTHLSGWENIHLSADSTLTLNADLVMGGDDALPTQLVIDGGSLLRVPEFNTNLTTLAGGTLLLENGGGIDLRGSTANTLRIVGDYRGRGRLYLDAVLGGDDSDADRLIIDGGHASGSTELVIQPYGKPGRATEHGILLVETRNGGSSDPGAFYMPEPIANGPYEYYLFRGTDNNEDANNWYLRSTLLPGSAPASTAPATTSAQLAADTEASRAAASQLAAPPDGGAPIPLYRPEIPLYSQIKSLAQQLSILQVSSYQQRRGEQRNGGPGRRSGWLRLYHRPVKLAWGGDMPTEFDGTMSGLQMTGDVWAGPTCHGSQEWGLFAGSSIAHGDVTGLARGYAHYNAGSNHIDSHYFGAFFSDYRNSGGYFDLLFKAGYVIAESRSRRGLDTRVRGPQLSLSLEKGFNLLTGDHLGLESQLQTVANYTNLSAYEDGIARVEPDMTPELSFRAGLRAYNTQGDNQYYLFGNFWHTLHGHDELLFDSRLFLENERRATWGEVGAGLVLLQYGASRLFFNLSYQQSLDALDWRGGSANLGFNLSW